MEFRYHANAREEDPAWESEDYAEDQITTLCCHRAEGFALRRLSEIEVGSCVRFIYFRDNGKTNCVLAARATVACCRGFVWYFEVFFRGGLREESFCYGFLNDMARMERCRYLSLYCVRYGLSIGIDSGAINDAFFSCVRSSGKFSNLIYSGAIGLVLDGYRYAIW